MPLHVVLLAPRNPLNIGAVARAMSNFGFFSLRLVDAYDVAFREARSAVHAEKVLEEARHFPTLADAVADCGLVVGATGTAARDLKTPVHRLEEGARDLRASLEAGDAALVFGSEKFGLSRADISHCHQLVHIPTREAHDSMNLGQAAAICLYELIRQDPGSLPAKKSPRRAPSGPIDRLHQVLLGVLKRSGYVKPPVDVSAEEKLRQFLLRMHLSARDATLLLGMTRQIGLALESEKIRKRAAKDWPELPRD